MVHRAIVGVDGRPSGRDAIALARLLVGTDGQLTLAHVYSGEFPPAHQPKLAYEHVERVDCQLLLEQEREATGVDGELISIPAPSVGRGLHHLVESQGADLLVVGSCSRGLPGRVLLGDDTRAALSGARSAVAVAPVGYAQNSRAISIVGVGYDSSRDSEAALALAREIAARHGADIHLLQVVQIPVSPYLGVAGEALDALVEGAEQQMAAIEGVEGTAVLGLAGEELAAFGERIDLLVVGSRGHGPLRRMMLGSTSAHLAAGVRCPLLVLPRAAAASGALASPQNRRGAASGPADGHLSQT
jgi:nucleotide-binding universal stress UspA family protein